MKTNQIKIQYESIWDGGIEIITNASLNLQTGEITEIESVDVEDLDILDSESIIVIHGSTTSYYDVVEIDGSYFVSKEDLKTINGLLADKGMK